MSDKLNYNQTNPFAHLPKKYPLDWHTYWLFEDSEFKNDLRILYMLWEKVSLYEASMPQLITNEDRIGYSPDDKKYNKLLKDYDDKWKSMTSHYPIDDDLLSSIYGTDLIDNPEHKYLYHDFLDAKIEKDLPIVEVLSVKFKSSITYEDYVKSWRFIKEKLSERGQKLPERKTRNRPPDDTRLIYCISKARKQGLKFSEIFRLYQEGKLSGYENGPKNNFESEDSLEAYYQKYKPSRYLKLS